MGMDISPRERLGYGGAVISLLAGPLMYYCPSLTVFIAIPMVAVGIALLIIAITPMNISGWRIFIYGFISLREAARIAYEDRKSTRLNSSHVVISYAVFCLKKKIKKEVDDRIQNIYETNFR